MFAGCFGLREAAGASSLGDERLEQICQHENVPLRHYKRGKGVEIWPASVLDEFRRCFQFQAKGGCDVHRNETGDRRWRLLVCALLGSLLCGLAGEAAAQESFPRAGLDDGGGTLREGGFLASRFRMRRLKPRDEEAATILESGDAKRFAARLKRHQRRQFSKKRRDFKKQQLRLETQRRARKARIKAHQFAAARRHAAQQAPSRRRTKTHGRAKDSALHRIDPSAAHLMVIRESPESKASEVSLDRNEENRDAR
jgi:hypothetical protein